MSRKPGRKRKLFLLISCLAVAGFFFFFNTSTRYGRWLFWQGPDWRDVDRFPYRVVENDPRLQTQFSDETDERVRLAVANFRVAEQPLSEFAASHKSTALIVAHNGAVLVEQYFQGNNRESLQLSFSCTKSVVSLLVGAALEQKLIDSVDEPITTYVNGLDPDFENVTIRNLLTMTAGFSNADEKIFNVVPAPWSDDVKAYYDPNCRRLATTFSLDFEPGKRFEYHDFSPMLIAMMLENVTHRSLPEFLSEAIWRPTGMRFSARWNVDSHRHGFAKPESGLNARAIDFARLGTCLLDDRESIVARSWIEQSVFDQRAGQLVQEAYGRHADQAEKRGESDLAEHIRSLRYGFYWWGVEREGRYDYYANGHFGQFIYVSPRANLVIVRNGTGHGGLNDWHFGNIFFRLASDVIAVNGAHSPGP